MLKSKFKKAKIKPGTDLGKSKNHMREELTRVKAWIKEYSAPTPKNMKLHSKLLEAKALLRHRIQELEEKGTQAPVFSLEGFLAKKKEVKKKEKRTVEGELGKLNTLLIDNVKFVQDPNHGMMPLTDWIIMKKRELGL